MDKFEYATMDRPGLDAWTNDGRRPGALTEFSAAIQGKPVSKKGIEKALLGLNVWTSGPESTHRVQKAEVTAFYPQTGKAEATIDGGYSRPTRVIIQWDPERGVIKDKPKSDVDLEKRVADLEAQVALLTKALASK